MLITTLIILTLLLGFFIYLRISSVNDKKLYEEKYKEIFAAHEKIGYPSLTDEQQFEILDNENTKSISSLTSYDFIPTGLLNHYLNIDPERYFNHLKTLNLIETMHFDPNQLSDGFFINKNSNGFEYIFVERQHAEVLKTFKEYETLLKYLVYNRLKLYAPEKYEHLNEDISANVIVNNF